MGGDFGPSVTVPAALSSVALRSGLHLLLVGDEQEIKPFLQTASPQQLACIDILHTTEKISNLTKPEHALRGHNNSSMYLTVEQVQLKQADACVSAGNTGALVLLARHLLRTIPGIHRPAMVATIPSPDNNSRSYLLDVGAHINSTARELVQFAMMGTILAASARHTGSPTTSLLTATEQNRKPKVGLLNIGAELHKGTENIRQAARILEQQNTLNYIGFIEANRLFAGDADVIVCDGFTGNISIKTSAGVVSFVDNLLLQTLKSSMFYKLLGLLASPLLYSLKTHVDTARFNGASLLGLRGTVIKSHGNASANGFTAAILQADQEVQSAVPTVIAQQLQAMPDNDLPTLK